MDLKKLQKPLTTDQIEFRVQSINNGGYATILAYKDARVDMQRLDEVCGPLNWKREHLLNNSNCIVSIFNPDNGQWVSKEDTGTASNTEAQKGLASDSFKRACFNWGIGRELYDYPIVSVKLNSDEWEQYTDNKGKKRARQTWNLKLREWKWNSLFDGNKIVALTAVDQTGAKRFSWTSDDHERFLATYKNIVQLYNAADAEGLVMALDGCAQDEELMENIWGAMKPALRSGIKDMSNKERKEQKEG